MGSPTDRQRLIWETTRRVGSQSGAARELGMTQGAVRNALLAYARATGAEVPRGPGGRTLGVSDRGFAAAIARAEAAEEALLTVRERLTVIEGKLDELLARPAAVLTLSDRRIVDGGEGRRHARRRIERGLPRGSADLSA